MERPIHSKATPDDNQAGNQALPSYDPAVFVEATIACIIEAIKEPTILIDEWRNKPMKAIVSMYRELELDYADLNYKYDQLVILHEETKKELDEIKQTLKP